MLSALFAGFALLLAQDPAASDNLKPPPDMPPGAVEADRRGMELLGDFLRDTRDRGPLDRAITQFRDAERLAGSKPFALAHYHLGLALGYAEQYKLAKVSLDKAIQINPNFHEAVLQLGDIYYGMRQYDLAIQTYDRAISLWSGILAHHRGKGLAWVRKGDFKQALACFEAALAIDEKDAATLSYKAAVEKEIQGPGFKPEYRKESAHFILTSNTSQGFTDLISRHLELIYGKYESVFPRQSGTSGKSRVFVFNSQKEYVDYGAPANTRGFYLDFTRKLVLYSQPKNSDTLVTLYHEAFHQFLAMYLDRAPQWFDEGHGDYFGGAVYDETAKRFNIGPNRGRLEFIQRGIRENRTQPVDKLMQMTRAEMYAPATRDMNYAQAWSLVYFFWHFENGRYGKLLQDYFRALVKEDGDLKGAYETVFGRQDMNRITSEWRTYISGLR